MTHRCKLRFISLLALLFYPIPPVEAETVSYNDSQSFNQEEATGALGLPKFDQKLGTLSRATFSLKGAFGAFTFRAYNTMFRDVTASPTVEVRFLMSSIGEMSISDLQSRVFSIYIPAATRGDISGWGLSYLSQYLLAQSAKVFTFTGYDNLARFEGAGVVPFLFTARRHIDQTPGTIVSAINYPGKMDAEVTYEYASAAATRELSVTISGNGSVNSTPPGIACRTGNVGTCRLPFEEGSTVTLSPSPSDDSVFAAWTGACSSLSGSNCLVSMTADKLVNASFVVTKPVRIQGGSAYESLQSAYDQGGGSCTIQVQAGQLPAHDFTINRQAEVVLKGGYDNEYRTNNGFTVMVGVLSIQNGSLSVEKLKVR